MALVAALSAGADTLTWVGTTGDYGTASNWDPAQPPTSSDEMRLDNGGTATISGGDHDADKLYMGRLANNTGHLAMSGGSLTVATAVYVASASGTTGSVTMIGSSVLTSGNFQIGTRGLATMDVGSSAAVTSAILYVASVVGSQGTLDLAGTWNATKVVFSNTGGDGRINLNGGTLAVSGDVDMDNSTEPSRLTVNGSSGSFSARDLFGADSGTTLDFVADAGGFTTLGFRNIDINGATLNINLDAYAGTETNLVLMDGTSLSGGFASVNFTGSKTATVVFDTGNGDLLLQVDPGSAYNNWADDYELAEGPEGDDDSDGLSNLYEYGLGGDPTNSAHQGLSPEYGTDGANGFIYVHPVQTNHNSGLRYYLELTDDLVDIPWEDVGYVVTGSNVTGGAFNYVSNRISTTVFNQQFVRLIIELTDPGVVGSTGPLKMPTVFSDHMVLQRDTSVPVWGTAEPGAEVVVEFAGQQKTNTVDEAGNWMVELDALSASTVPRELVVSSEGYSLEFADVVVGEVWLCSGQSNMYRPIGGIPDVADSEVEGFEAVLALPENTTMRLFCDDGHTLWDAMQWQTARSETLELFSGVAYFFGKSLQDELDVPIGLLLVSRVGTTIQAWTPPSHASQVPLIVEYQALYQQYLPEIQAYNQAFRDYREALAQWNENPVGDKPQPPDPLPELIATARTFANVSGLYNNYMAPLVPFALRGTIWYQGESNAAWEQTARRYDETLWGMAEGLREAWGDPGMPFYYVQLPNYGNNSEHWPWIRQSMLNAYKDVSNVGMAVTVDVGEGDNLHPPKKQPVGERLALWALTQTYGEPGVYSGPLPDGASLSGSEVHIQFDTFGSILEVQGADWTELEVAGDDGIFYSAAGTIGVSNAVVVCPQVAAPEAVRYGWEGDFVPTLFNTNGLPASPFCLIQETNGTWRLCTDEDPL